MILTKEDYDGLTLAITILNRVCRNAVLSELEEERERKFNRKFNNLLNGLNTKSAFEKILKELKRMPNKFREIFNEEWFNKHLRRKASGVYELRCSMNGTPISGAGKTPDIAAENFIKKIVGLERGKKKPAERKVTFNEFAEKWFKLVKKPMVKPNTYQSYLDVFNTHVEPFFKGKDLKSLTAMQIQPLFLKLIKLKFSRTAQIIKVLLNQIFKAAVGERLIPFNPMDEVKIPKHQCKKGIALTIAEERNFLDDIKGDKYELTFALLLFGGMRRGELHTARLENDFIIVDDGKKRADQIPTARKIPITPMLKKYLHGASKKQFKEAIGYGADIITRAFKKLCPAHHLHELRHTFITRCQECGVTREVVSVWAGHAADKTMTTTVYTHFSEEFMLSESEKVDYFGRLL